MRYLPEVLQETTSFVISKQMKKTTDKKERWEYHIHYMDNRIDRNSNKNMKELRVRQLNNFGQDGWEIINIVKEDNYDTYYFKRKK